MQAMLGAIFFDLFLNQSASWWDPAARATQLADVALALYEAGGAAIRLPLPRQHPLVHVLGQALQHGLEHHHAPTAAGSGARRKSSAAAAAAKGKDSSLPETCGPPSFLQTGQRPCLASEPAKHASAHDDCCVCPSGPTGAASLLAGSLLDSLVSWEEDGEGMEGHRPQGLRRQLGVALAMHGLAVLDPALVLPVKDSNRFLRTMLPYVTTYAEDAAPGSARDTPQHAQQEDKRRQAEVLLCLLSTSQACLESMPGMVEQVRTRGT